MHKIAMTALTASIYESARFKLNDQFANFRRHQLPTIFATNQIGLLARQRGWHRQFQANT
jgi:hypothetical protein